mgnify:CR=1 FL=1
MNRSIFPSALAGAAAILLLALGCAAVSEREEWLTNASGERIYRVYCEDCHQRPNALYIYELSPEDLKYYVEFHGQEKAELRAPYREKVLNYLLAIRKNRPGIEPPVSEWVILNGKLVKRPPETH